LSDETCNLLLFLFVLLSGWSKTCIFSIEVSNDYN
jgi:hypothetical protein